MLPITKLLKNNSGFIVALILLIACRSSVADWYHVPTGSMQPTIVEGDRIFVNKLAYQLQLPFTDIALLEFDSPKAGDIIVFESQAADNRLVKRVIGTPGDVISMTENRLMINGQVLQYDIHDDTGFTEKLPSKTHRIKGLDQRGSRDTFAPVIVPEGHYLVLGDNRNNSVDSRVYGFVPMQEIQGRASRVVFSLDLDNYYIPRKDRVLYPLI